ncbi:hypothetical protein KH5H1_55080 [Corallococcus caeni]|uniref:hypothetical protein n=1 Tax=Corallococcus caeni TaxID=3082388 RepID=UPI002956774C|nr:hypothetical protein KH5H1_55080 [Corallococcus sp. KH5-1]
MPSSHATALASPAPLQWEGLLDVAATLTGRPREELSAQARVLLHGAPSEGRHPPGVSDLNANGSPLQLLLAGRAERWASRLIGDPCFDEPDAVARAHASRAALGAALAAGRAQALTAPLMDTLDVVVPWDEASLREYPTGILRLALPLGTPGVGLYASPPPGAGAWDAARRWVRALLPRPEEALRLVSTLAPGCRLLGVGLEGESPARARAKLYWRLEAPAPLSSFALPLLEAPTLIAFLTSVLVRGAVPPRALTFSAGFELRTGALVDAKADVCTRSAGLSLEQAVDVLRTQTDVLPLHPFPLRDPLPLLHARRVGIGCLGLGIAPGGVHRLNVYLFQQ